MKARLLLTTILAGGALLALGGCRSEGELTAPPVITTPSNPTVNNPAQDSTFSVSSGTSASDTAWIARFNKFCRDQEITTGTGAGRYALRMTPTGTSVVFAVDASRGLTVRMVQGMNQATSYTGSLEKTMFTVTLPVATTYTFGVVGFDCYIKSDGVELYRFKQHFHMAEGCVGVKVPNGTAYAAITGIYYQDKAILSDIAKGNYDLRDFGWRRIATTGSMSAASTTLTLPSDAGFEVGDHVIVEIGGETGAGVRGTKGVGGTWPALSYANAAAMNADVGQANNTYAWLIDTGYVYRYSTGSSTWSLVPNDSFGNAQYYVQKAVPKALCAQITAIGGAGTSLTLSTAATVATTNANVYLDCAWIIHKLTFLSWGSTDFTSFHPKMNYLLPDGDFPCQGHVFVNDFNRSTSIGGNSLIGKGKEKTILRSPRGTNGVTVGVWYATDVIVRDLQIIGNLSDDDGFGLNWVSTAVPAGLNSSAMQTATYMAMATGVTETNLPQAYTYPYGGVLLTNSTRATAQNVKTVNSFAHAVGVSTGVDCWAKRCEHWQIATLKIYVSWQFQMADSSGGGFQDCSLEAASTCAGWEAFKSTSTTFLRCSSINGLMATNGSEGWAFTDCTIHTTSLSANAALTTDNPCVNINNNIGMAAGAVDGGGTISNITITQTGYNSASNDNRQCIVIQADTPNVAVTGGTITVPDYVNGAPQHGAAGVISTGANTDVTSLTVVGKAKHEIAGSGYRNINLTGGSGSSATSCTANEIYVNP